VTDHDTPSVTIGRILYIRSTAMRPNKMNTFVEHRKVDMNGVIVGTNDLLKVAA